MSKMCILLITMLYFWSLVCIAHFIEKKHSGNEAFFLGNHRSPWHVVAFGMIGSSLSGITLVSVPGMVRDSGMTYMQMVLGFLLGYVVIAFFLLPIYYRLNSASIYTYLRERIGKNAYRTGAGFFLLSRTMVASTRLYLAILILHTYILDAWHIPFSLTSCGFLLMIWFYTRKGGIKTIVWTDVFQTFFLLLALGMIFWQVAGSLHLDGTGLVKKIRENAHTKLFVWNEWSSRQNFFKQFFSGFFLTIAMTGIDQEMMQKNLSCKSLREAKKNVCTYGLFFLPVNLICLSLGVLLLQFASEKGIVLPSDGDAIVPSLIIIGNYFGTPVLIFFVLGIVAVTFASADSSLTGITTSVCFDFLDIAQYEESKAKKIRLGAHLGTTLLFIAIMEIFRVINHTSLIDAIYTMASYVYGPLLGLFGYTMIFKWKPCDRWVFSICILSPILCFVGNEILQKTTQYQFGYELLIVNALLVIIGLRATSRKQKILLKLNDVIL